LKIPWVGKRADVATVGSEMPNSEEQTTITGEPHLAEATTGHLASKEDEITANGATSNAVQAPISTPAPPIHGVVSEDVDMDRNAEETRIDKDPEPVTSPTTASVPPPSAPRGGWLSYLGFPGSSPAPLASSAVEPPPAIVPPAIGHVDEPAGEMEVDPQSETAEEPPAREASTAVAADAGTAPATLITAPTASDSTVAPSAANIAKANDAVISSMNTGWSSYVKSWLARGAPADGAPGQGTLAIEDKRAEDSVATVEDASSLPRTSGEGEPTSVERTDVATMDTRPTVTHPADVTAPPAPPQGLAPSPNPATNKKGWFRSPATPTAASTSTPPPASISKHGSVMGPPSTPTPLSNMATTSSVGAALPIVTPTCSGPSTIENAKLRPRGSSTFLRDKAASLLRQNLVLPTFEQTFERPPRKIRRIEAQPPLPPPPPSPPPTAVATLTWKALGAVSSYVRPAATAATTNKPEVKPEGSDLGEQHDKYSHLALPRLNSKTGPASWQGVRRVVVVGIHGWFPNKNVQL
jgi:hypothetical protein